MDNPLEATQASNTTTLSIFLWLTILSSHLFPLFSSCLWALASDLVKNLLILAIYLMILENILIFWVAFNQCFIVEAVYSWIWAKSSWLLIYWSASALDTYSISIRIQLIHHYQELIILRNYRRLKCKNSLRCMRIDDHIHI